MKLCFSTYNHPGQALDALSVVGTKQNPVKYNAEQHYEPQL